MPRFKPKGMLERNALADLWKHTLSGLPGVYARLCYLASLRDPNSGQYRHHGLSAAFGRDESTLALRQSHEQVFKDWLKLSVPEKSADFKQYLATLEEPPEVVAGTWMRTRHYETVLPDRGTRPQRTQFRQEMETMLLLTLNASAGGESLRDSTRSL